jgi:hypothetical protein
MESSRFLFASDLVSTGRRATRPPKAPQQLVRPRIWTLSLMNCLGASVDDLNRQLVLPPSGRPFVFGKEPRPEKTLTKRDWIFQGPLERGTDPAGKYFGTGNDRYCLAERVEGYIPGSRAWLLEPLAPYLELDLPPVGYAVDAITRLSLELGLYRISGDAIKFGAQERLALIRNLADQQLDQFSKVLSPRHLSLLVALYHERCWHDPKASQAIRLGEAVHAAFDSLIQHAMFRRHEAGEVALQELRTAQDSISWNVRKDGQRSARPQRAWYLPSDLPTLFCRNFEDSSDADYCASLGVAIPLTHYGWPRRTRFSDDDDPSKTECFEAFSALISNANIGDIS